MISIPLRGRTGVVGHTLIDDADAAAVSARKWYLLPKGYAYTWTKAVHTVYLHRFLMDPPPGMVVDHINGDKLDNRRCNLRVCTPQQNMMNYLGPRKSRSANRGVRKVNRRWHVRMKHCGRHMHLGTFATRTEARAARRAAELNLRGAFAPPAAT